MPSNEEPRPFDVGIAVRRSLADQANRDRAVLDAPDATRDELRTQLEQSQQTVDALSYPSR
ncbi:hypothetical protein [Actinomycetospora termitidis]|uniref:Uncharacterized protein n=1 Tax=Actinomycetospora termitidis TaxID=3053470 RepID=A0ABT7MFL4_9PSEU|nr:hypothetical protein [Actinomycetospora sp. Odt1-22]MDL5159454.1 hypothetical protein [Actinomycetospora sp. Odt1-22]